MLRLLRKDSFRPIWLSALLHCCCAWCQGPSTIVIVHVNVVDVRSGDVDQDVCVVVEKSRILSVGKTCGMTPRPRRVINGRSEYLIPGLWDMHVHSEGDGTVLKSMLGAGITGVRDMGGDVQKLAKARKAIKSGELDGPTLLFAGPMLEGPPAKADEGTWLVQNSAEADRDVSRLSESGVDFIKVHDHLSREVYFSIANAAKRHGLPFAGHVSEWISPIEASEAGQASIEHFEFLPKPCVPLLGAKNLPVECESQAIGSILRELAKNGTFLDLTLQSFQYWVPAQWLKTLEGTKRLVRQIRTAKVRILAGTDWSTYLESRGALPGWCLHDELEILVRAGFTPLEALQAATLNPAVFFGMETSEGTVEPGKAANLVLLRANPLMDIRNTRTIAAIFANGRSISRMDQNGRDTKRKAEN
jgi:imidazolonepropionase-like amidohydrolase